MLRVGIIGYGYWGPNLVRNFHAVEGAEVVLICDLDAAAIQRAHKMFPGIPTTQRHEDVLASSHIDIVVIATPVSAHYPLAKAALEHGKHVLVEKPFTASSEQAEDLIRLAEKKKLTIMVDHTFLFTGSVLKIKELVDDGTLGDILYYDSSRVNLGLFQHDVNVIWDLAPHDFSVLNYLMPEEPVALSAHGVDFFGRGVESAAFVTVYFSDNRIGHFNFNWFSPVKIRRTLIGGTRKMLVWNDLVPDEKVRIYDKGVDITSKDGIYDMLVQYRTGDMFAPKLDGAEALHKECQYFVDCVNAKRQPMNDGHAGLRVVRMLEACDRSLRQKGALIELTPGKLLI